MEAVSNTSDAVKELAIQGKFLEIEKIYGKKRSLKAENYVESKLKSLREKLDQEVPMSSVAYATPFMMFALNLINTKVK